MPSDVPRPLPPPGVVFTVLLTEYRALTLAPASVGHAATHPFAYEMFGKEERTAMTHVDSLTVKCHLGGCLIAVLPDASENIEPERSHIMHSVKLSWPELSRQTSGPGTKWAKMRVCTMCTPWASDRVVLVSDRAGLRRFSGEWRKFKCWNPVRVPPRAQCFRRSGAF